MSESVPDPVACVCGESETLEVEHSAVLVAEMRMTCPCGLCGPWEVAWGQMYASWNDMQRALKGYEKLTKAVEPVLPWLDYDRHCLRTGQLRSVLSQEVLEELMAAMP